MMRRSSFGLTLLVARVHLERARHHIAGDVGRNLRQPVADEAGDRLGAGRIGNGADEDAAIPLAADAGAELASARAQRVEEIAERGALHGFVEPVDGDALPQPVAPARLARNLRVEDHQIDVGVGRRVDQVAQLQALLGSARWAEQQQVILGPARHQHRLATDRAHRSRQLGRIDGVDKRRVRLWVEARRGGERDRAARFQRQRADACSAQWPLELGDCVLKQPAVGERDDEVRADGRKQRIRHGI